MGLQTNQEHVLGRETKVYMIKETTPGTFVKATTAASAQGNLSIVPNQKRKDRTDAYMASRSIVERITDKTEHSWSYDGFWIPSGTKNTAPDVGDLVLAAMGVETVNANDVTYTLNSSQALTTLSMTRHASEIFQESIAGAWVEEFKLAFAGGEEPRVTASGGCMTYAATGTGTTNGAIAPSATTLVMVTADKGALMTSESAVGGAGAGARSVIQISDGSSPDTDIEVTVDSASPSFTTTTMTNGSDDAAAVTPWVPTHTDAGSPISGINGTFTHNSFSAVLTAFELTLTNNVKAFDDEAFTRNVRDVVPNLRTVAGTATMRVRKDHVLHILNRQDLSTVAISLAVGGAAQSGTRLVLSIPTAEVEWAEVAIPETEEATITLPFRALGSSGNDEFSLQHT